MEILYVLMIFVGMIFAGIGAVKLIFFSKKTSMKKFVIIMSISTFFCVIGVTGSMALLFSV